MTSVCGTRQAARQPSAGYSRSTAARAALWSAGVAVLGLAADAAGRAWALSALRGGHRITVVGGLLRFQLVINHGAAFGIAAGYEPLLAVASVAGIVLLGICAVRASSRAQRLGAALAAGGAAGNLLDRLARPPAALHGGVVDWLHVPVLRSDIQPGRPVAPRRPAARRRFLAVSHAGDVSDLEGKGW